MARSSESDSFVFVIILWCAVSFTASEVEGNTVSDGVKDVTKQGGTEVTTASWRGGGGNLGVGGEVRTFQTTTDQKWHAEEYTEL